MAGLVVNQGDYGYYINFTIKDASGDAYVLTDYTIKLKVWKSGQPGVLIVNGVCSIISAVAGTCRYLVVSADFITPGEDYLFELELTKTGVVESTKTYALSVRESG